MNQNFIDTIYLFACGAQGIEPDKNRLYNFEEIYNISQKQVIWNTVFPAVKKLYQANPDILPENTYKKLNEQFVMHCAAQYKKYTFIHQLIKKFDDNGIENCILKGESIARFYNTPIARISSDTDILINPKKVDLCLKIMREHGFDVGSRAYDSHQIECTHPFVGLVEIHTMMYGKKTEDICFKNEVKYEEEHISIEAEDGMSYKTLGITDNFIFLFLHFIKHFLWSGVGARQLMDVLLYVKHNVSLINWEKANSVMSNLGFRKIFECMIAIGEKYLMFPKDVIIHEPISDELMDKVFSDMFEGGIFGHDDLKKEGFYDIYLNKRYKSTLNKSYSLYKNKRKLTRLFPNQKFMAVNFPYVNKSKLLLPVAWVHRIIKGIFHKDNKQISDKHNERLKLLQELEMI